jgi:hypothetical protein
MQIYSCCVSLPYPNIFSHYYIIHLNEEKIYEEIIIVIKWYFLAKLKKGMVCNAYCIDKTNSKSSNPQSKIFIDYYMAEEGENKVELKVAAPKTVDFTFRMTILVLLAVQNAAHALMSRYSKVYINSYINNLTSLK